MRQVHQRGRLPGDLAHCILPGVWERIPMLTGPMFVGASQMSKVAAEGAWGEASFETEFPV